MSNQENDLTSKVAFALALHELTGASICGLIESSSKDKPNPKYTIKHVYGKLANNTVLSINGFTQEETLFEKHKNCFLITTNKVEHFLELINKPYSVEVFNKTKENFKAAILDNYKTQLAL